MNLQIEFYSSDTGSRVAELIRGQDGKGLAGIFKQMSPCDWASTLQKSKEHLQTDKYNFPNLQVKEERTRRHEGKTYSLEMAT